MSLENPYESPQGSADDGRSNVKTSRSEWSPFQSQALREIAANMTPQERRRAMWRGAGYGLWCAASCGFPAGLLTIWFSPIEIAVPTWLLTLGAAVLMLHFAFLPIWMRMQRQFLCDTEWAREQSIQPGKLKLFPFLFR